MSDIFSQLFAHQLLDPVEATRRSMQQLPRRFFATAYVGEVEGEFRVLLDGRPARTPARSFLAAPTRPIAEALCAEWQAQTEVIDPSRMPLTRQVNSIIDGVAAAPGPVADEVVKYLGSDLLLYRAERPQRLVERQAQLWDPVLNWADATLGARFVPSAGIIFAPQPAEALARMRAVLPLDPWRLGAVHVMTTLTGSALIALAVLHGRLSAEEAWHAAHVDEDFNLDTWGHDEMALARRAFRYAEMQAAATVLAGIGCSCGA
jgi:chaperone required for assembly of F1-ATPase